MPNAPLHNTSARPPDGIRKPSRLNCPCRQIQKAEPKHCGFAAMLWLLAVLERQSHRRRQAPLQEAERNRCAGGEPHGCGERRKGPGTALVRRPRSDDGAREVWRSQTRMAGLDLLVTFGAMPKVTRRKGGTGIGNNMEAASSRRRQVTRLPPQCWMKRAPSTLRIADIPVVGWTTRSLSTMVRYNHRSRMSRNAQLPTRPRGWRHLLPHRQPAIC